MLNAAQQLLQKWADDAIRDPGADCGFTPQGTPPRLRRILNRAERKAEARALQRAREADPCFGFVPGSGPNAANHLHPRRFR